MRVLLESLSPAEVELAGWGEVRALHVAVMRGELEVVVLLVEAGASTTAPDLVQFSALHYAAWWGRLEVAEYLLGREGGTSLLSCLSCVGDTPLHLAVWRGHLTMCGMFLSVAGEVNVQDGEHHSPVHVAAYCGHQEILSLLTQPGLGPDLQQVTIYQDTPLHLACYSGNTEAARTLLAASPPDTAAMENVWSETALHAACTSGKSKDLVNLILGERRISLRLRLTFC